MSLTVYRYLTFLLRHLLLLETHSYLTMSHIHSSLTICFRWRRGKTAYTACGSTVCRIGSPLVRCCSFFVREFLFNAYRMRMCEKKRSSIGFSSFFPKNKKIRFSQKVAEKREGRRERIDFDNQLEDIEMHSFLVCPFSFLPPLEFQSLFFVFCFVLCFYPPAFSDSFDFFAVVPYLRCLRSVVDQSGHRV